MFGQAHLQHVWHRIGTLGSWSLGNLGEELYILSYPEYAHCIDKFYKHNHVLIY